MATRSGVDRPRSAAGPGREHSPAPDGRPAPRGVVGGRSAVGLDQLGEQLLELEGAVVDDDPGPREDVLDVVALEQLEEQVLDLAELAVVERLGEVADDLDLRLELADLLEEVLTEQDDVLLAGVDGVEQGRDLGGGAAAGDLARGPRTLPISRPGPVLVNGDRCISQ